MAALCHFPVIPPSGAGVSRTTFVRQLRQSSDDRRIRPAPCPLSAASPRNRPLPTSASASRSSSSSGRRPSSSAGARCGTWLTWTDGLRTTERTEVGASQMQTHPHPDLPLEGGEPRSTRGGTALRDYGIGGSGRTRTFDQGIMS